MSASISGSLLSVALAIVHNVLQIGDSWLFSSQFCQSAVMFSLILKKKGWK